MLDTPQEAHQEAQLVPSQVHQGHLGGQQQATAGGASAEVSRRWGEEETVVEMVVRHRLEWLGYVARIPDHRIPKSVPFRWLSHLRPQVGPRRRWRDVTKKDLKEG